jgi:capsular polysaccharide biosynthesis protein
MIVILSLAAAIGSSIFAFLLPVYYKSTSIFYPYSLDALNPKNILSADMVDVFGTSGDVERLLQIGNSSYMANIIIKKFNLYKRYDIDTVDNKYAEYEVMEEFNDNIDIKKNDMGAVEVTVYDQDPNTAADISNEIVRQIDRINKQSVVDNNVKIFSILKSQLEIKHQELEAYSQSFKKLQSSKQENSNVLNPKSMSETGMFTDIDIKLADKIAQALEVREKYEQVSGILKADFNTVFIIEEGSPAVKKAKPFRTLIVLGATFLTFALSILFIMLLEYYKNNIHELLKNEN